MSHLFNNLGHRLAATTFNALPYLVAIVFALYLYANIPSYASGMLVAGLPSLYWFGAAIIGLIIVLALFGMTPKGTKWEATHDHD